MFSSQEPALYWRSDSRHPEDVFAKGFTPKQPIDAADWWKRCINDNAKNNANSDANPSHCVSMSFDLTSCRIFPCDQMNFYNNTHHEWNPRHSLYSSHATYLYAIAVPALYSIDQSKELSPAACVMKDSKALTIDFHSYQVAETQRILSSNPADYFDNQNNILIAGGCLYGYEAFTSHVDSKNIIFAEKVARSKESRVVIEGSSKGVPEYNRSFKIDNDIIFNPKFEEKQSIAMVKNDQSSFSKEINYASKKAYATQLIRYMEGKEFSTPSMSSGFRDKEFVLADGKPLNLSITEFTLFRQPAENGEESNEDTQSFQNDGCVMQ